MSLVPVSNLPYSREGPLPFQLATSASLRRKFEELIENLHKESKSNAPPQSQPLLTARTFHREMEKFRGEILTAVKDAAGVNEFKAEVKKLTEVMENHATSQSTAMQEIRERITQLQSDFQENNLLKWFEEDVNKDFQNNPAVPTAEPSTSSSVRIHSVVQKEDKDCLIVYEGRGTISKRCFLKSETSGSGSQQTVQGNGDQQVDNAVVTTGDSGGKRTRALTPDGSVHMNNESEDSEDDGVSLQAPPESRNGNVAECAGPTSNEQERMEWVPGLTLRSRTIMVRSRLT